MSESTPPKKGGCLCGKIKFTMERDQLRGTVCYCLNCRRATGSALYTAAICPKDGFTITEGEEALSRYADTMTDSGKELTRTFCSHCGSNLFNFTALNDGIVSISAGAFDDFEDWRPTLEQYCIHRAEFLHAVKDVERRYIESINGDLVKEAEPEELT